MKIKFRKLKLKYNQEFKENFILKVLFKRTHTFTKDFKVLSFFNAKNIHLKN